uniref:Uncharacterized protein n=1 Tax=Panagrellus redivivus TaxID=6233 RepID=A0A7E4VNM9_PANRE
MDNGERPTGVNDAGNSQCEFAQTYVDIYSKVLSNRRRLVTQARQIRPMILGIRGCRNLNLNLSRDSSKKLVSRGREGRLNIPKSVEVGPSDFDDDLLIASHNEGPD